VCKDSKGEGELLLSEDITMGEVMDLSKKPLIEKFYGRFVF